jgi:hypothetical protein
MEVEVVGSSATLDERFAEAAAGGGLVDLTVSSCPAVPSSSSSSSSAAGTSSSSTPARLAGIVKASDALMIGDRLYSNSFKDDGLYYRGNVTTVHSNCVSVRFEDGNGTCLRMRRRLLCWALPAGDELYEEGEGEGGEGEGEGEGGEGEEQAVKKENNAKNAVEVRCLPGRPLLLHVWDLPALPRPSPPTAPLSPPLRSQPFCT